MTTFDGQKPEIEFPCHWGYRIIGAPEAEMRAAIVEVVGAAEHTLEAGGASSGGKYVSLRLTVRVENDEHRLTIHRELSAASCVKMVL